MSRRIEREISPGLREAIEAAGGKGTDLAKVLGITAQAVQQWETVPVKRLLEIERKLGIPRARLCPELYAAA